MFSIKLELATGLAGYCADIRDLQAAKSLPKFQFTRSRWRL